ncbi:hypothetical protein N4G70_11310 [Streptomyces sp. ASQP_92]|uniref:hypothetical protein n=1 Tax=Streptomyces sp. ASQP_92 TaxID=2979116 RepID=UPI0021BE14CA|nr:hypothetical protein [Streptomyces sp. ASQP_92]MCT9089458.1 hypothetical protein [Streptomyces sp. ASQP_92]
MSARSTARFVRYRVMAHPDEALRASATCTNGTCHYVVLPTETVDEVSRAMQEHTARTGHAVFCRTIQDTAVVVLADRTEQERRAEANALEYRHLGGAAEDARADA